MPGKYSHLKDTLTKFSEAPDYQSRVNDKKDEIRNNLQLNDYPVNPRTIGQVYADAREEKDRLEKLVKAQNLIIESCQQMLVDMLESQDVTKITFGAGLTVSIKDDVYVTVKDKGSFYKWIDENDLDDLYSVNYQTMSAMVKTKLIEGEELPPGNRHLLQTINPITWKGKQ